MSKVIVGSAWYETTPTRRFHLTALGRFATYVRRFADIQQYVEVAESHNMDDVAREELVELAKGDDLAAATAASVLAERALEEWQGMRAKPGPKPKPPEERKSVSVQVRMTVADREAIRAKAKEAGLGMSEYIRLRALE